MRSKFSRRSYKEQTYIDGVRVTRKMLKALAIKEAADAAAEALRQKQVMLRRVRREEAAQKKAEAAAEAEKAKIEEVQVQPDEAKEE